MGSASSRVRAFGRLAAGGVAAWLLIAGLRVHAGPDLGQLAIQDEIAAWDISIAPDGRGLPPGRGTASEGRKLFLDKCAECHGQAGGGGMAEPLVGGIGSLASDEPMKTVGSYWPYATTLFDYVRRAMPYNAPQSLSNNEVYSLCAYILFLNELLPESAELNAATLPQVAMPNRYGFVDPSSEKP
ncbi:MAG: cytochrome C biogenesis protein CcdA [Deltaproteobacteria bacterium]|jgi:cytochrome c|nr:cytochrome C biogenesis protein CcdA [Deltaproteobacteria bacterium]